MLESYEKIYYQIEKNHWWNCSRRDFISKLINNITISEQAKIIDIGCSTGVLLEELSRLTSAKIFGIDVSKNAINATSRFKKM